MSDALRLTLALAAGAGLGLLYFLGLWQTVRRLPTLPWAPLWLLASLALRLAILLGGLYWIGAGDWRRFVAGLGGVVLVRLLLTRHLGALPANARAQATGRGAE